MIDALAILKQAGAVLETYPAPKGQRWPTSRLARVWNLESARRFYPEPKKAPT